MPVRVVDASVLAAWCFREPRAQEAMGLIRDTELYAPFLLAYELASIARQKAAIYPEKLGVLKEALQLALALPIHWRDVDHMAVLHLALVSNLTTYDASYLYLAGALGARLVTFDKRLLRVVGEVGYDPRAKDRDVTRHSNPLAPLRRELERGDFEESRNMPVNGL